MVTPRAGAEVVGIDVRLVLAALAKVGVKARQGLLPFERRGPVCRVGCAVLEGAPEHVRDRVREQPDADRRRAGTEFPHSRRRRGENLPVGGRAVGQHEQPRPVILQTGLFIGLLLRRELIQGQVECCTHRRTAASVQPPRLQVTTLGEWNLHPGDTAERYDRDLRPLPRQVILFDLIAEQLETAIEHIDGPARHRTGRIEQQGAGDPRIRIINVLPRSLCSGEPSHVQAAMPGPPGPGIA
jgi:hypothetical protein